MRRLQRIPYETMFYLPGGPLAAMALGWLDVWGDGEPAGAETRRVLSDLGALLAMTLGR